LAGVPRSPGFIILDWSGFQVFGQPQAFWSQSWRISFSNVGYFFVLNPFLLFAPSGKKIKDGRRFIGLLKYLLPGMIKRHS